MSGEVFNIDEASKFNRRGNAHQDNYGVSKLDSYGRKEEEGVDDLLKAYIEKVDRDQDSLREDIREFERRTEKRIQDSEDRMDKRLDKIEELISSQNEKFDKIGEKIIDLDETVRDRLEDHKRFLWGIALSVIIGIAGMVIAVIIA